MTFEKCHAVLSAIRRNQGTRCPLVRVDYGGLVLQGRLARSDSDPGRPRDPSSPYGVLVLEHPGLTPGRAMILQIADIPDDGLRDVVEECAGLGIHDQLPSTPN